MSGCGNPSESVRWSWPAASAFGSAVAMRLDGTAASSAEPYFSMDRSSGDSVASGFVDCKIVLLKRFSYAPKQLEIRPRFSAPCMAVTIDCAHHRSSSLEECSQQVPGGSTPFSCRIAAHASAHRGRCCQGAGNSQGSAHFFNLPACRCDTPRTGDCIQIHRRLWQLEGR